MLTSITTSPYHQITWMSRTELRYRWRQLTDDDTAVDSSDVQGDIGTTSFSDAVQSVRMLHANVDANGCLGLQPMVGVRMWGGS